MEKCFTQMEKAMMECGSKVKRMGKELTSIKMEAFLGGISQTVKNKEQAQSFFQMAQKLKQLGKTIMFKVVARYFTKMETILKVLLTVLKRMGKEHTNGTV